MPTTFLAIAGLDPDAAERRLCAGARWFPSADVVPTPLRSGCGRVHALAAATMPGLQRGVPVHAAEGAAVVVDGGVLRGTPLTLQSAADLARGGPGADDADWLDDADGTFSVLELGPGRLRARSGFLGVSQLYTASTADGGLLVGNRPLPVAAALADLGGALPQVDAEALGWLVSASRVPFGEETFFPGVSLLPGDTVLAWRDGVTRRHRRSLPVAVPFDAEQQAAALVERCRALAGTDLPMRIALTGGKDSRLVLAAAVASGLAARIDHAYLKGHDGLADVQIGRRLAAATGLSFRLERSPMAEFPPEAVDRHLALTGGMLGAWDLKAHSEVPSLVGLHGGFGEIYKSHAQPFSRLGPTGPLGWAAAGRFYRRPAWLDPFGLLRDAPRARIRARFAAWFDACRAEGQPLADLHDRWHRECRMRRWLAQSLQAGAAVAPMLNPLGGRVHLEAYLGLPLRDRIDHRWHFEVLRVLDPALLKIGLAGDRWHPRLRRGVGGAFEGPIRGAEEVPVQRTWFARHADVIANELLRDEDDGFWQVVRRDAARAMVERARAQGTTGPHRPIEMSLALWTMRRALNGRFEPTRISLAPSPNPSDS